MVHAHEAVPELAALAALAGALAVLPYAALRPVPAGALFGAGLGFAFLSSSWIAPAALFGAVAAAHAACDEWRTRKALPFLGFALLVAAVVSASWPLALRLRSSQLFDVWWAYGSLPYGSFGSNLRYYVSTASWFTWPAWPLALWAIWALRRRWRDPRVFVPVLAALLMLGGVSYWGPDQDVNLIPMLAPLALLASQGIPTLRRGAAAALDWFGTVTFGVFAGVVWLGYVAMMTGVPARFAANFVRLAPGFAPQFQLLPLLVALALSAGWVYVVFFTAPSPLRSVTRWATGIVLLWGIFAMLWMPWVDYQKSYRGVAKELAAKIPPQTRCITARSVGLPQRAALNYHAGIRTVPYDPLKPAACPLMLVQGHAVEDDAPGAGWVKLAELSRPGDRNERQRLYALKR